MSQVGGEYPVPGLGGGTPFWPGQGVPPHRPDRGTPPRCELTNKLKTVPSPILRMRAVKRKRKDKYKQNPWVAESLGLGYFSTTLIWAKLRIYVMRVECGSYPEKMWSQTKGDRRITVVVKGIIFCYAITFKVHVVALYFVMQFHLKYNVVLKCPVQWSVKIITFGEIYSILKCLFTVVQETNRNVNVAFILLL